MPQTGSEGAQGAGARSRLYAVLASVFAFPDQELHSAVRDGALSRSLAEVCAVLPYDLPAGATAGLADAGASYADFESEYIRLFDVGAGGPPCPLYGGVYQGDRMKVMEDATRFYNFFELHVSADMRELPDHITTELEFLHYLTFRESELPPDGPETAWLRRAERDFLERHLCRWVPKLAERLAKQQTCAFYPALVEFAQAFFTADRAYAKAIGDG